MTFKTKLDFTRLSPAQLGLINSPTIYNEKQARLDAYANVFDFINNKTDRDIKSILVFLTDEIIKNGAKNLKISIEK